MSNEGVDILLLPEMSRRCRNALLRAGIRTTSQLKECYNDGTLGQKHGIGPVILDEVGLYFENNPEPELDVPSSMLEDTKPEIKDSLMFEEINMELVDKGLTFLELVNIPQACILKLESNGIYKVGDLQSISYNYLNSIVGPLLIVEFKALEAKLQFPLKEIIILVLSSKQYSIEYQIVSRLSQGELLNQIAGEFRMPVSKAKSLSRMLLRYLDKLFYELINPYICEKKYITFQEVINIYDNSDYSKLLIYWCDNTERLKKLLYANIYVPNTANAVKMERNLNSIAENIIGDGEYISNCTDSINNEMKSYGYDYIDIDTYIRYLLTNGYTQHKDFIAKKNTSYGYFCSKVISKYYPSGFKIYNDGSLNQLREYVKQEFGDLGLPENNRSMQARIFDYTLLCNKGTVIALEDVYIEKDLLKRIKFYIDTAHLSKIDCLSLYKHFKKPLSEHSNIDNEVYLFSVLKLHFKDEYDFSERRFITMPIDKLQVMRPVFKTINRQRKIIPRVDLGLSQDFPKRCKLRHKFYGEGIVVNSSCSNFTVDFKNFGIRKLDYEYCIKNNTIWRI